MISLGTKKEIRMVLPEWSMALVLAASPLLLVVIGTLLEPSRPYAMVSPVLCWFSLTLGCTWLATAVFGKENIYGTAEQLFALPLSRKQICLKKGTIALMGVGSTILLYLICVWLARSWSPGSGARYFPRDFEAAAGLIFLCTLGPGLFFTAFFRSFHEAFWITLLAPFALLATLGSLASQVPYEFQQYGDTLITVTLLTYGVVCTGLAWATLRNWQATGQQKQSVVFRIPRFLTANAERSASGKAKSLTKTLIVKELRLHQLSFFITLVFACIYAGFIYWFRNQTGKAILTDDFMVLFRMGWLIIPAMIGAAAIAEERSIGVSEWHRTLPISHGHQWKIKLSVALILGYLLGGIAPYPLDHVFQSSAHPLSATTGNEQPAAISVLTLKLTKWIGPLIATLIGYFASSLTRSLLQALLTTTAITILLLLQLAFAVAPYGYSQRVQPELLASLIMTLTLTPLLLIGASRYYTRPPSFARSCGLILGVWALTSITTKAFTKTINHRVWDSWSNQPEVVSRPASAQVNAQIIRDQLGFTILNNEGTLYHLGKAGDDQPGQRVKLRTIGPDQKWQSIQFTHSHRFAITLNGGLWAWHRSFDFPRYKGLENYPPHQIPSGIPWKEITFHHVPSTRPALIYGVKTDGTVHRAELNVKKGLQAFAPLPDIEPLSTLRFLGESCKLGITQTGHLLLLGHDRHQLMTGRSFSFPPQTQPEPAVSDLFHATVLDRSGDWKAIHIHPEAVLLPTRGYTPGLNERDIRTVTARDRFALPVFEKRDGTFWTMAWIAKFVYFQNIESIDDYAIVPLPTAAWLQHLSTGSSFFAGRHLIGLRSDNTLWEIKQTQIPMVPTYQAFHLEQLRLSQRRDWVSIQTFYGTNTLLGLTENDILWTWGEPLAESSFFDSSNQEKIRLIAPRRLPKAIYDLRSGKPL